MASPFDFPEPDQTTVTEHVTTNKAKRYLVAAALISGGVALGAVFSPIGLANAQNDSTSSPDTTATTAGPSSNDSSSTGGTGSSNEGSTDSETNPGQRHQGGHVGRGHKLDDVASILGLTTDELRTQLQGGKTLGQIAQDKGISADDLVSQMVAKLTERLNQAVADGRITQAQADTKLADADQRFRALLDRTWPADRSGFKARDGVGRGAGPMMGDVQALADSLGIDLDTLRQAVVGGQTIAEAAAAQGVSAEQLKAAALDAATKRLDQAVADGKIDQARADALKAELADHIDGWINGSLPDLGRGPGRPFGHGPGLRGGPHGYDDNRGGTGSSSGSTTGDTQQSSYTA
jgi:uncharacterized protein YidB (DUF937 family)